MARKIFLYKGRYHLPGAVAAQVPFPYTPPRILPFVLPMLITAQAVSVPVAPVETVPYRQPDLLQVHVAPIEYRVPPVVPSTVTANVIVYRQPDQIPPVEIPPIRYRVPPVVPPTVVANVIGYRVPTLVVVPFVLIEFTAQAPPVAPVVPLPYRMPERLGLEIAPIPYRTPPVVPDTVTANVIQYHVEALRFFVPFLLEGRPVVPPTVPVDSILYQPSMLMPVAVPPIRYRIPIFPAVGATYVEWGKPFYFNSSHFGSSVKFYLEVFFRSVTGDQVYARLFDLTVSKGVDGSEIRTYSTSFRRLRTTASLPLIDTHEYRLQLGKTQPTHQGEQEGVDWVIIG